jgi:hypothetical protein
MKASYLCSSIVFVLSVSLWASAQTTEFTYQGRLTSGGVPVDGGAALSFHLYDALTNGSEIGVQSNNVTVTNGIFSVKLDFGAVFPGADRYLEIWVHTVNQQGQPVIYTLSPRQKINASPYAISSTNASQLGGLAANQYVLTGDARLSDARQPMAGSPNYIQNGTAQQPSSNFNVSGNGTFGGTLTVNGAINGSGAGITNINGANITGQTVTSAQVSPDLLPNSTALKQLGSLRWDLLKGQTNFQVAGNPTSMVFDGTNIWVGNSSNNSLAKIRASDGTTLGIFNVGQQVNKLAFDGANIWVANAGPGTVTKIRASDGANLGSFPAGPGADGVAYDGANLWISNPSANTVSKVRAFDGANLGQIGVGSFPIGVAYDGANIWVTNNNSGNVTKLNASTSTVVGTFAVTAGGAGARGIAFDGANVWIAASGNVLTKLRVSDGANQGMFTLSNGTDQVTFDGANIWVSHNSAGAVSKIRTSDGAVLAVFPLAGFPLGMSFDGANIWVANGAANSITRLPPAFPQP